MNVEKMLLNAFQPDSEISDPSLFAGRVEELREVVRTLHTPRSMPLIYGHQGVGKSSIAAQARRIASGDVELLHRYRIANWAFTEDDRFLVFYLPCTDAIRNVPQLLERLINLVQEEIERTPADQEREVLDVTVRAEINAKLLTLGREVKSRPVGRVSYSDALDAEERLLRTVDTLVSLSRHRVLFVIDELDRVGDTAGLASFIKSHSSEVLRFMLVGVAQDVSNLLSDHSSLERLAIPVHLRVMLSKELEGIVSRVETYLQEEGLEYRFAPAARRKLAWVAGGFPWYVHVLGQEALRLAYEDGTTEVTVDHVQRSVATLHQNRWTQQFSDLYQTAVRDSSQRETVLRMFACWGDSDIPLSEIYRELRKIGISNPSVYKKHLMQERYGRVLVAPPFVERGLVRFLREPFKIYIRNRESVYVGVKEKVDRAWAASP
jgi:Cdc6-like AAA superfamily ATPase